MDELFEELRSELVDRYELERELGRGGMAVVYLARDVRHERNVAIKVLRPDVATGARGAGERFLSEIRIAAQLHHPHILPLYDSGTAGNRLFYVMPYVQGESLRRRIDREGPMAIDQAVAIAREVADALEFAHRHGIIHRDIKPENILLSAGHAAVADFGIARAVDAAGLRITETGMAIGTPAYMSPEQATADPHVDARADQYALGCVLYEMLAGQPPFSGATSQILMARHTADPVPSLTSIRPVSLALENTVRKALAKVPADRYPSAQAFGAALGETLHAQAAATPAPRKLPGRLILISGIAGALAIVAAIGWFARTPQTRGGGSDTAAPSVAVLPFTYSGDSAYSALAYSVREDVITGLVRVEGLRVPDIDRRASSDSLNDARHVGRALGVGTVLSAAITAVGNRVHVAPRLVNVADGLILWQGRFYGELSSPQDLFNMQDSIVLRIVDALVPQLSPQRRMLAARGVGTRNADALRLFAQARAAAHGPDTPGNYRRRAVLIRQALDHDSTYSDAWSELAMVVDESSRIDGTPSIDAAPEARRLVEKAIALDSSNAKAYELRGRFQWFYDWNWEGAERDIRHAMALAPASSAVVQYCWLLHYMNERDSALALARRLAASDPENPEFLDNLANRYLGVGMVDSAIAVGEHTRKADPTAGGVLISAYLRRGRRADAARIFHEDSARFTPDNPFYLMNAAQYYATIGDTTRAKELRDRLNLVSRTQYVQPILLSIANLSAGDRDVAIRTLVDASRVRDRALPVAFAEIYWDLKGDDRVEAVRRKVYGSRTVPPKL